MTNRLIFYSSVKSIGLFNTQKFYKTDIDILNDLGFNVFVTNKLVDFLFFWKYDFAFIYFYRFGLFGAIVARMFGKKVFFTGGIDDLDRSYAGSKRYIIQAVMFKLCYFFSTKCILVSTTDTINVTNIYGGILPKKNVLSFHTIEVTNFLCKNETKEDYFTTIAWMESVGNVIRKGVDLSLLLFSKLANNYEKFRSSKFIIIGKMGEGSDYLKKICNQLNIEEKVVFTDEIDEVAKIDILKRSRYYMQLSKYEGFGIAAAEALAARNIVLNSGKGGLKDSVGKYGVHVNIDSDLDTQIKKIYDLIMNIDSETLKEGEKYVIDRFSYNIRKNDFANIIFK